MTIDERIKLSETRIFKAVFPNSEVASYNIGTFHLKKGNFSDALKYLNLIRSKYSKYYSTPNSFLQKSINEGKDNWWNQLNSGG